MNKQIIIKNSSNDIIDKWTETKNGFYTILKSDDTYSLTAKKDINSELVMIGGGGAGGYFYGGGGGAGCAYYNDNFNFNKNNKYDFNIGKGGKSILNNFDNIFNGGLELKGYYNTKPKLDNFSITDNDVSSLLINKNSMDIYLPPFVIHNVDDLNTLIKTTNNSIDKKTTNGYSLVLTGFITVPQDGKYTFHLNTDHLVYMWIDMHLTDYTNNNAFIQTESDGVNKQYSKELKAGVYYKIKILIYNSNSNQSNQNIFSLIMKNKKYNINTDITTFKNFVFSLNENNEKYDITDATATKLLIDNKIAINCDGGGIGGYGINTNDKINVNGGCGGGAGLNQIAGKTTVAKNENYFGSSGSTGENNYTCGGGGGVYSGGFNSNGGDGIKIDWFNDKIGLGGEGSILNVYKTYEKKYNYGSGGDGGGVFDKEFNLCGKSGIDGCVLIYVKKNLKQIKEQKKENEMEIENEIETFANPEETNIFDKYIKDSFLDDSVFTAKNSYEQINKGLINCDNNNFTYLYADCLFYLHLYSSLYTQLEHYNINIVNYDIIKFKNFVANLKIKINIDNTSTSNVNTLNSNIITIHYNTIFNSDNNLKSGITGPLSSDAPTSTGLIYYVGISNEILKKTPILTNITNLDSVNSITKCYTPEVKNNFTSILGDYENTFDLEKIKKIKNKLNFLFINKYTNINGEGRLAKFINVLYEIFSTPPENIMGYLLYYKIFYNIIIYNLSIQYSFRANIINNSIEYNTTSTGTVKTNIENMTTNIQNLIKLNFQDSTDNEFLKEKAVYASKILLLNDIKKEYTNNQILLNKTIKSYNDYFKNFEKLKSNATFAIVLLVTLIIVSVIVFASPTFSSTVKQTYNMTANTLLIITTFMYYQNFKDVVTFENFAYNCTNETIKSTYTTANKEIIFNTLTPPINAYNTEIKNIMNKLRNNIYIAGSKSFSTDGNKYLYNLFLEKKQKNEVYKTKRVTVTNLIEALKKQVSFLFNIILLVSIVIIIALSSFMAFSLLPEMLGFIIFISVILLIIICAYFINAIVQPTKLVANKNYWANETPSEDYLNERLL